jgi:GNAT superfamily N-acetyltransferase
MSAMGPSSMGVTTLERLDASSSPLAVALLRAQFDEHDIHLPPGALERAVRGLVEVSGRGALLLAREEREAIGVAALSYTWALEHGGQVAWLDELYVIPRRRGHGVGTLLLLEAVEVARADGCIAVDLEVEASHDRAQALYLRHGFEALTRTRFVRRL